MPRKTNANNLHLRKKVTEQLQSTQQRPDETIRTIRYKGRRTGLSYSEWLYHIFVVNEELPPMNKRSDATILGLLLTEFGHYPQIQKSIKNVSINQLRTRYNSGRLVRGEPVNKISFRYGTGALQGIPVTPSTGRYAMSINEMQRYIRKFRGPLAPLCVRDVPRGRKILQQFRETGLL